MPRNSRYVGHLRISYLVKRLLKTQFSNDSKTFNNIVFKKYLFLKNILYKDLVFLSSSFCFLFLSFEASLELYKPFLLK